MEIKRDLERILKETAKKVSIYRKIEPLLKETLSSKELKGIRMVRVRKKILYINVESSGLFYLLNLKKTRILNHLQSLGIKDVRFKVKI